MDELRFKIDAFRPETIPMVRLAEYMKELAALLGNGPGVHFVRLETGSAVMVHRIDGEYQPDVKARLLALGQGDGPADAVKAYKTVNAMLAKDNTEGNLSETSKGIILQFPGKNSPEQVDYGPLNQFGSLDGIPVAVGGIKEDVPVHIQESEGTVHHCHASREIAGAIAKHIFVSPIRVHGTGRWHREKDGVWKMLKFTIADFEVLNDTPLKDVVAQLREIPGDGWRDVGQPLAMLRILRCDEGGPH